MEKIINFSTNIEQKQYKFGMGLEEEVQENVRNILNRYKGNVPLNREKGIDSDLVDQPVEFIELAGIIAAKKEIERDEPRFIVKTIKTSSDGANGDVCFDITGVIVNG